MRLLRVGGFFKKGLIMTPEEIGKKCLQLTEYFELNDISESDAMEIISCWLGIALSFTPSRLRKAYWHAVNTPSAKAEGFSL